MSTPTRQQADWLILICVDVTAPLMLAWEKHVGGASTAIGIVSALLVLSGMNGALLLAFNRRNKRQSLPTSKNFILAAIGLATVSACSAMVAVALIPGPMSDTQIALSNTPLEDIEPGRKRVFAEFLRRLAAIKRDEDAELEEARKHPFSPPLYSSESFASIDVIHETEEKVKKYALIDLEYGRKNEQAWSDFRQKMGSVDPDYLRDLSDSQAERLGIESKTLDAEKQWLTSTVALYDFAAENSKDFKVQNGQITFSKHAAQAEFEKQRNMSKSYLDRVTTLERDLAQRQRDAQGRSGITFP
jgi:hypothetical protein